MKTKFKNYVQHSDFPVRKIILFATYFSGCLLICQAMNIDLSKVLSAYALLIPYGC